MILILLLTRSDAFLRFLIRRAFCWTPRAFAPHSAPGLMDYRVLIKNR